MTAEVETRAVSHYSERSPVMATTTSMGLVDRVSGWGLSRRLAGLRDLVVFVDGGAHDARTLAYAAALAAEHEAHLTGVLLQPAPVLSQPEMFARGPAIRDVIAAHEGELGRSEAESRRLLEDVAARHGVRLEWRVIPRFTAADAATHARYSDLAVAVRDEPRDRPGAPAGIAESLVLTSGRPTVVLPPRCEAGRPRRVLVGWNAGREAARAVADALPLLLRAEAVTVVVVEERRSDFGPEPGADIARHLARHGLIVDVTRLQAGGGDAGRLLLSEADASRADLVVIGAYGHSPLSERVFGGVTRTFLHEAPLPVLMSR